MLFTSQSPLISFSRRSRSPLLLYVYLSTYSATRLYVLHIVTEPDNRVRNEPHRHLHFPSRYGQINKEYRFAHNMQIPRTFPIFAFTSQSFPTCPTTSNLTSTPAQRPRPRRLPKCPRSMTR